MQYHIKLQSFPHLIHLAKSFGKFNPKIQAFKRVLELTRSKGGGAEETKQFNSFNDF